MPVVQIGDIVEAARRRRFGVGAFNVVQLEHVEAIVAGAEVAAAPVVLQISQNCVGYHGALEPIALATLAIARNAQVPVAVHLDRAESVELVDEALALGFGSVMFDASALEYDENVRLTREVTQLCRGKGVWVEAEVGGKDGGHTTGAHTDPAQAAEYVAATGVDALAIAVGTSHAMALPTVSIDLDLVRRLRAALQVPLVLPGSFGVPFRELAQAVDAGITKVNVATQLNKVFTTAVRRHLAADPEVVDTRRYLAKGRGAVSAECARLLGVLGARL